MRRINSPHFELSVDTGERYTRRHVDIRTKMPENLGLLKKYWCKRKINQPDYPIDSGLQLSQVLRLSSDWLSAYRPNSSSMVLATSQVQIAAIIVARLWLAALYMRPASWISY